MKREPLLSRADLQGLDDSKCKQALDACIAGLDYAEIASARLKANINTITKELRRRHAKRLNGGGNE